MAPNRGKRNITADGLTHKIDNSESGASEYTSIREGLADISVPASSTGRAHPGHSKESTRSAQSVFYNPIQQFNRDLSVLAIKAFGEDYLAVRATQTEKSQNRGKKRKRQVDDTYTADTASHGLSSGAASTEERPDFATSTGENGVPHHREGLEASQELSSDLANETPDVTENEQAKANPENTFSSRKAKFKILDALSASGLRAIRYAKEIPFVTSVVANDMSPEATASIRTNVQLNELDDRIEITTGNAMSHMYDFVSTPSNSAARTGKYDVIDLDPYGTASPFFDAAMHSITDGGLLCVTCTDAGVWASCGYPEKTYALYGGFPIKGHHSHEGGLRLILHSIASSAAKYGMAIEPLLSLSIDFYARIFVRVFRSQAEVKLLAGKTMLVYSCDSGCGAWTIQPLAQNKTFKAKDGSLVYKHGLAQGPPSSPLCDHCGMKTHLSGPMYGGPLHNPMFLRTILDYLPNLDKSVYGTIDRMEGMLFTALEETLMYDVDRDEVTRTTSKQQTSRTIPRMDPAKLDKYPFFFIPSALAGVVHCQAPREAALKGALKHAGYEVTRSHIKAGTIKTNAPWSFIWHMMREWEIQKSPVRLDSIKPRTAAWKILESRIKAANLGQENHESGITSTNTAQSGKDVVKPDTEQRIVFDEKLGHDPNRGRLVRYQQNPRENWGPMARARGQSPKVL